MGYEDTKKLFQTHVCEVVATRRIPKPGFPPTRRFLCTINWPLLNSIPSKAALHFRSPSGPPPFDAKSKNLITVWDIIMQDWRNINLNQYRVLGGMPVRNAQEIENFWQYFNGFLSKLSATEKSKFMNS